MSGTVGETTLTVVQIASHEHQTYYLANDGGGGNAWRVGESGNFTGKISTTSAGGSKAHTHSLTGINSGSASLLPPYYALAYIMRYA